MPPAIAASPQRCCAYACREAANGIQLEAGLQHPISNILGLRSNGFTQLQPVPYFGNALSFSLIPPPSNKSDEQTLADTLAAAACAVRQGTQDFRADADGTAKKLHAGLPMLVKVCCCLWLPVTNFHLFAVQSCDLSACVQERLVCCMLHIDTLPIV